MYGSRVSNKPRRPGLVDSIMRELYFRGRDDTGQWYQGLLSRNDIDFYIANAVGRPFAFHVQSETVGQYTGLKDVNDLEIFEDDIVFAQTTYYGDILAHVVYEDGAFGYRPRECKQVNNPERWKEKHPCVEAYGFNIGNFYSFSGGYSGIDILCMEVAGNVHDNPELLELIPF